MHFQWELGLAMAMIACVVGPACATVPTSDELAQTRNWVAKHFAQAKKLKAPVSVASKQVKPGLDVVTNYGPVQQNSRDGQPLKIADRTFTRGLYCHATSKIDVTLPGPAKSFTATVGIDTNGQYSGGSVVFKVSVGGKDLYASPVMHRGEPGVPVDVDIGGAKRFTIAVGDGGDNINSDQSSWGDAKVTLADGREIWLGDMEIAKAEYSRPLPNGVPFSFVYNGRSSDELLGNWKFADSTRKLDAVRTQRTQTYTDPKTGLQVRCVIVQYKDFPTVEWTLYLKNTGKTDTPIIEGVQALDTTFKRTAGGEFLLHHFIGSVCGPNDYQPVEAELGPSASKRITTAGGRPTNSDMPYFNIETGEAAGVIAVISWAGQWAAAFDRDKADGLRVYGGQETTRFKLLPGEEVRTPMSVLQFYSGDWIRAQNVWRSWMVKHNIPKLDGKPIRPLASVCTGNSYPGIITNAAEEMKFLRRYIEEGIVPDFWWQDAGWYPCGDPPSWSMTGTWEVEKTRWPKGIREVSDWLKTQGIRTIVWFEPERCGGAGTWLYDNHKDDWLLGGALLNMGNPDARKWLTDHIDKLLTEQGIDLYRQDFNIDPLSYWRANDADDRQGITEMKYVEGYFAYWDELKRRHNGMLIDSCASGGRRNDLETLRRAVPLLRSDYTFEPVGEQCHTYGCSFWWPFNGTGFLTIDKYLIRSQMSPEFTMGVDTRRTDQDYDLFRKLFKEWKELSPCYFGDYYPLTPYSLKNDVWMAWQFDRPDTGEGFVQAFRRAECLDRSVALKLRGLDPNATYTLVDLDAKWTKEMTGKELAENPLVIESDEKPAAIVVKYKRK